MIEDSEDNDADYDDERSEEDERDEHDDAGDEQSERDESDEDTNILTKEKLTSIIVKLNIIDETSFKSVAEYILEFYQDADEFEVDRTFYINQIMASFGVQKKDGDVSKCYMRRVAKLSAYEEMPKNIRKEAKKNRSLHEKNKEDNDTRIVKKYRDIASKRLDRLVKKAFPEEGNNIRQEVSLETILTKRGYDEMSVNFISNLSKDFNINNIRQYLNQIE